MFELYLHTEAKFSTPKEHVRSTTWQTLGKSEDYYSVGGADDCVIIDHAVAQM